MICDTDVNEQSSFNSQEDNAMFAMNILLYFTGAAEVRHNFVPCLVGCRQVHYSIVERHASKAELTPASK